MNALNFQHKDNMLQYILCDTIFIIILHFVVSMATNIQHFDILWIFTKMGIQHIKMLAFTVYIVYTLSLLVSTVHLRKLIYTSLTHICVTHIISPVVITLIYHSLCDPSKVCSNLSILSLPIPTSCRYDIADGLTCSDLSF